MSIKPKYFNLIKLKEKKVEFRKVAPRDFNKIYLYVSYPVKSICGFIEVDKIITANIDEIWEKTKTIAGISEYEYKNYCGNKKTVSAIFIKDFISFNPVSPKNIIKNFTAPQNYIYNEKLSTLV